MSNSRYESLVCYECEMKKQEGTRLYCKRCNRLHFLCKVCIPTYIEYEVESGFDKKEYSGLTQKEFQ